MGKLIHGLARRHGGKSKTYLIWHSMRARCKYPSVDSYQSYGGRGIHVCDRWESYPAFLADMGECPSGQSIDRIDTEGAYTPDNCRWAPMVVQQRNRRNNNRITFRGETKSLSEWAEQFGMRMHTLRKRIYAGWPLESAMTAPVKAGQKILRPKSQ